MDIVYRTDAFADAKAVRKAVFMNEQGFENEFEPLDEDAATLHLTAYADGTLTGCARAFPVPAVKDRERLGCPFIPADEAMMQVTCDASAPNGRPAWVFGRLAVLPASRGLGLGSALLAEAERVMTERGAVEVHLHAQCDKAPFYERHGYVAYGEVEMDEHVPHRWMRKRLG